MITHLTQVKELSTSQVEENYKKPLEIISYCHDFGKYTTYFQSYLFSKNKEKSNLSNHGFISSLFAAYTAFAIFKEEYLPYMIFNVVLHHHGSLENPSGNLPEKFTEIGDSDDYKLIGKIDAALKQIEDMKNNRKYIEEDYKKLGYGKYFNSFIDNVNVEELLLRIKKIDFKFDRFNKNEKNYFIHQTLYSALISADKMSASNTIIPKESYVDYYILNNIKEKALGKMETNKINKIRSEIFKNIQDELEKSYKENKLFSITAPTGTGKTYSGFFAALKLKDLLGQKRRIIYSLPFTSIIEQNYQNIYDFLQKINGFNEKSSTYIIKHHNLSNIDYVDYEEDYNKLQAELLIENWSSAIVVTTFVQLLETLIGSRNRMLKKFNSIKGSIILLDEVQAIDIKLYKVVDFILRAATTYLDCRIIMMTATKPLILKESHELLKNNEVYFSNFNRTVIIPYTKKEKIEDFIERFLEKVENKSYLIIVNTINSSLKIYDELRKAEIEVYYLSTNLLPKHREERIKFIKRKLDKGEKIVLVSTQVVEAGVDLDFDEVYRDIAPIDSIIQSAGRCNRNGKKPYRGIVNILFLINDKEEYYAYSVYGKTLVNISKNILCNYREIEESTYYEVIKSYFEEVNKNINDEISQGFIQSIDKLYFSKANIDECSINRFSLIKKSRDYIDVFLRVDNKGEEIFQKLLELLIEKNIKKKREMYLAIKNEIRDYTLSIPIKYKGKIDTDQIIINLPKEGCDEYYNEDTGFFRGDEEEYLIF